MTGNSVKTVSERGEVVRPCVNCGGDEFAFELDGYDFDTGKQKYGLRSCTGCRLTRTSPLLTDEALAAYYQDEYFGSAEEKFNPLIEKWTVWSNNYRAKKILSQYSSSGMPDEKIRVLDIGCGRANLLKAFSRLGCQCYGVERGDFPESEDDEGIEIHKGDLKDIDIESNSLDIVVIWHVLEHLDNPVEVIVKASELLKPGGKIVIAVPNYGGIQGRLFGKHWFHLDLPRHLYHFSRDTLENVLSNKSLVINRWSTNSLDQSVYGFMQSSLNSLAIGKPNKLYEILKTNQKQSSILEAAIHVVLAGMIAPLALLEYLLSNVLGSGACLIVTASKK